MNRHRWTCSLAKLPQGYPIFETSHPLFRSVSKVWKNRHFVEPDSLFAKISEETPANLLDSEFSSSSTAAVTSARESSEF